jgi:ABC-type multidrug transport system ATPase subunit
MEMEIKNLRKAYGEVVALDDLSINLTDGIYALLGPNGAGKSTLINILTDNIKRTSGTILWNGEDILKMGEHYRSLIGYMPQQQGMYDDYRVKDFLVYMACLKGIEKRIAKEQIDEYLNKFHLYDKKNKKIKELSGGMKQRCLLVQALLGDPKLLILDEPTAGLDPSERINLRNIISDCSEGRIVIFATHVVSDVDYIAKEVIIIKKGQLAIKGDMSEVISTVEGKVGEILALREDEEAIRAKYIVENIMRIADGIKVRVVGDKIPQEYLVKKDNLNLEDVYLFYTR